MLAVSSLAAHPGNVRTELHLTDEFVASITSEGVRIPLLITPGPDGRWRVIEGHRRLAAAVKAGLADVPCAVDSDRAGDEAGQYLDMLLANSDSYRANYSLVEETAALFAAHEAGASRTRIRKATGHTAAHVKTALAAGQLPDDTKAKAVQARSDVSLDDLALLAEFNGDEAATGRLLACLEHGYSLEHAAERIRQDRLEAAEHARIRADLEAGGVTVTDSLPDGAAWLTSLRHDDEDVTPESHAACPGHGATFQPWSPLAPAWYCASPAENSHTSRWNLAARTVGDTAGPAQTGQMPDPAPDAGRRLVISGNKAWRAAAEVRHRWLATSLFPRRSAPREAHVFLARQLLTMPDPLRSGLTTATGKALFAALTGHEPAQWDQGCDTAPTARLAVTMLCPIITAYEHAMTDGEGRNTWRTDRYSPCPRRDAGQYLNFLASIGYRLSDIEQAVADGTAYTGDTQAPGTLPETEPGGIVPDLNVEGADGSERVGSGHSDGTAPPDDIGSDDDAGSAIDP